jgi:leader peptidase (prepilin peptidase)/N-methyltransferase
MLELQTILVGLFGACIGSFLNVVILRLPKKRSLNGRSSCPHCKRTLHALDMIPVLSYLVLGGRCRSCKKPISVRYALIELITAGLFMLTFLAICPIGVVGYITFARDLFIMSALVVVFVIDLEHFLIFDTVVFSGIIMVLIFNMVIAALTNTATWDLHTIVIGGMVAAAVSSGIFLFLWYVSKGKGMGLGDVKLLLFLGLAVGWPYIWVLLFLAFFLGTIYSLPLLVLKKKHLTSTVPFGTFLAVATCIVLLYGEPILHWYLQLAYKLY